MKIKILLAATLFSWIATASGPLSLSPAGALTVDGGVSRLEWLFVREGWSGTSRMTAKTFLPSRSEKNRLSGEWLVPGGRFNCDMELRSEGDGSYRYSAGFTSPRPVGTAMLALILTLPTSVSQISVEADGREIILPAEFRKLVPFEARKFTARTFRFQDGEYRITLRGDFGIRIQDDRKYRQNNFSIRFYPARSEGAISQSELSLSITLEKLESTPVDIRQAANMGFRDETADDGRGGWSDQGPNNDFRSMTTGKRKFSGVTYEVIDPSANGGKSCIVVADPKFRKVPSTKPVELAGTHSGRWLYLLHASAWTPRFGDPIGEITVDYADGKTQRIPVISGRDCGNWWRPADLDNAAVAFSDDRNGERVGVYSSGFRLDGEAPRRITFTPATHSVWMIAGVSFTTQRVLPSRPEPFVVREGERWTRLDTGDTILKGSPLDLSGTLDAPAGKHGRVIIRNGSFSFEKQPDRRIRFLGVNLCHQHCFMPHDTVDRIVERITRLGYNSVRLHHIDRKILAAKARDSFTFDPERLDQLFYLWAKCREAGLYLTIDLYSMRPIRPGDGIEELPQSHGGHEIKTLIPLSRGAMNSWKRYAKKLMTLRNPYTGLSMAEDPALYSLNLVNEAALPASWNRYPALIPFIEQRYAECLREQGRYTPERAQERGPEFHRFLIEKEAAALEEMIRFVKEEIGFSGAVTNYNFNEWSYLLPLRDRLDFVDNHSYQDHPNYPQKQWQLPAVFRQISSLEEWGRTPGFLAPSREFGKPYTITEMQFCNPNIYRSEAGTVFAAVAGLQDYDGVYRFSYGDTFEWQEPHYFAQDNEPVSQLTEKMLHFLFLRGDIAPATEAAAFTWRESAKGPASLSTGFPADFHKLALYGRIGNLKFPRQLPGITSLPEGNRWENGLPDGFRRALQTIRNNGKLVSSTGEIEIEPARRRIRIVTPKSEAFSLEGGTLSGNLLSGTVNDRFQTISVHSLDGRPLAESDSLLLLHVTNTAATGMRFYDRSRRMLESWGKLPLLVERGRAELSLRHRDSAKLKIDALAWDGSVRSRIPATVSAGILRFTADTANGGNMIYHIHK